jgi:topoisomerase IV subunit A
MAARDRRTAAGHQSTQKVLEEVEELTNPKVRLGKKSLTPEQVQLKAQLLGVMDAIRDESGREARSGWSSSPKTSKIDQQMLISAC